MRKGPSSLRRWVAGGALLLWSALSAVLPAIDAAAERVSEGARSHVEATGGSAACTPVHNQAACQLCRMLRLPTKAGDAVALFPIADIAIAARPATIVVVASAERNSGRFSRAPPSA